MISLDYVGAGSMPCVSISPNDASGECGMTHSERFCRAEWVAMMKANGVDNKAGQ